MVKRVPGAYGQGVIPGSGNRRHFVGYSFVGSWTREAACEDADALLKTISIKGLAHSVKSFDASHPALVNTVNDICLMLSQIGIQARGRWRVQRRPAYGRYAARNPA